VINQIFIDDIKNESRKHIDTNHYLFPSDFWIQSSLSSLKFLI
jgi:hypothetical protein